MRLIDADPTKKELAHRCPVCGRFVSEERPCKKCGFEYDADPTGAAEAYREHTNIY